MLSPNLLRLLSALTILLLGAGYTIASCIIPGTESSCAELVSGLPWQFQIKQEKKDGFYLFLQSQEGTLQRGVRLKMNLGVSTYENKNVAVDVFSQLLKDVDPDMGLSYGWDLVMVRDERLYRLHADCTLAEQHFDTMARTFERIIGPTDSHPPFSFYCRCGGGCKLSK